MTADHLTTGQHLKGPDSITNVVTNNYNNSIKFVIYFNVLRQQANGQLQTQHKNAFTKLMMFSN